MADNTTLNSGTGGDTISTDVITTLNGGAVATGEKAQRVKVGWGVDATFNDTSATNPLPITNALGATAAKQPALGTAGTPSTDVLTVQGIASGTAFPVQGAAQTTATGAITAAVAAGTTGVINTTAIVVAAVPTAGNATISIKGTYVAQFAFEASDDSGTTWYPMAGARSDNSGSESSTVTLTNVARMWNFGSPGITHLRVRCNAFTSGSATILITPGGLLYSPNVAGNIGHASDVSVSSTIVAAAGTVVTTVTPGMAGWSMGYYGTYAVGASLVMEASHDGGSTYYAVRMLQVASGTLGYVVTIAALVNSSSAFTADIPAGATHLRVRCSAWASPSGTINVVISQSVERNAAAVVPQSVAVSNFTTAAAIADASANPTTTQVQSDALLFNGTTWDRQRNNFNVNTGDTGAQTATFNGATQTNYNARGANILFNIGTVTGTTPTLTAKLQGSSDGGTTFYDIPGAVTPSITATGATLLTIYPGVTVAANSAVSSPLPRSWRAVYTIGGTTPSFTITNVQVGYIL